MPRRKKVKKPSNLFVYYDSKTKTWCGKRNRKIKPETALKRIQQKNFAKVWVKSKSGKWYKDNKVIDRLIKKVKIPEKRLKIPKQIFYFYDIRRKRFRDIRGRFVKFKRSVFEYMVYNGFVWYFDGKHFLRDKIKLYQELLDTYIKKNVELEKMERTDTGEIEAGFLVDLYEEDIIKDNVIDVMQSFERVFGSKYHKFRIYIYSVFLIPEKGEDITVSSIQYREDRFLSYDEVLEDYNEKVFSLINKVTISDYDIQMEQTYVVFKGW